MGMSERPESGDERPAVSHPAAKWLILYGGIFAVALPVHVLGKVMGAHAPAPIMLSAVMSLGGIAAVWFGFRHRFD